MTDTIERKLAKAQQVYNLVPNIAPGLHQDVGATQQLPYHESIRLCRYFYRRDGIANTVVNRISEITATTLRNRRRTLIGEGDISDTEFELFNIVARRIQAYLQTIILSYLIDGMAIPQYEIVRIMGSRVSNKLGRTRYYLPEGIWCRNPETIILKRILLGGKRRAFIRIPSQDVQFVQNRGTWPDGTSDRDTYNALKEELPEYIAAIEAGQTVFPIDDYIIHRKLLPHNEYPLPFLESALNALDHKRYLKMMDRSIATRAIEAFRHIKVGNDEYPADDDDIDATKAAMNQTSSLERVYNLYTNHTIDISWVVPPLEIIMNDAKYNEANADIFFAVGFPRILTVGETEKSNAADNKIAALGIIATLKSIQLDVLEWIKRLYTEVAEKNNISRIPEPYFTAIPLADVTQLIQYARDMLELGVISKDTAAAFYGSDHATETDQLFYEKEIDEELNPEPEIPQAVLNGNTTTEQSEPISTGSGLRSAAE